MELIYANSEHNGQAITKIQEYFKANEVVVKHQALNGIEDVKKMAIDVKLWTVIVMDDPLLELLESCAKTVLKLIKMTSKPNKIIYYVITNPDKMEMLESEHRSIVDTVEQLDRICTDRAPAEYDEISNTCSTFDSLSLESVEPLSKTLMDDPKISKQEDVSGNAVYSNEKTQQTDQCKLDKDAEASPSVFTNQLYPCLSHLTSYVNAGMSHNPSGDFGRPVSDPIQLSGNFSRSSCGPSQDARSCCRPPCSSIPGSSFSTFGPPAMPCQSGVGHFNSLPVHHSTSCPHFNTLQTKSMVGSDPGARPNQLNNFHYRPEILDINRHFTPPYDPNIQTDGSDNNMHGISCDRCGHSVIPKQRTRMSGDVGPSSETFHSADGASGVLEKEYMHSIHDMKVDILDLKGEVFTMIRDSLDCAEVYNWKKLADLHKWSFRRINELEQKWKSRRIESPFMHLIEEFQHYTLHDLKNDLRNIPRRDLLNRIEELQNKGLLFHT